MSDFRITSLLLQMMWLWLGLGLGFMNWGPSALISWFTAEYEEARRRINKSNMRPWSYVGKGRMP